LVATGLTANTTYYYRVQAQNAAGTVTSSSEQTFTTTAVVGSIASFYGYPTSTDITLNWVLGSGDSQAMVRYSTLKYPTSTSDGTLVITQAATSYDLTGLSSGQTYYFSIWGLSGVTYSASAVNLVSTTSGAVASSGSDTYPSVSSFEQTISSNKLAQFQPVYSFVNDFINGWGMPNTTGWFLAWLALSMFMGLGAGFLTHKLLVGAVLLDIMLLMGILLGLITGWMLMVIFVVALGEWAIFKYVM
jgi:hypothetical protein